jgi:hypothetical protein
MYFCIGNGTGDRRRIAIKKHLHLKQSAQNNNRVILRIFFGMFRNKGYFCGNFFDMDKMRN